MKEDHSIIIQIGPHAECLKGDQQYFSRTTELCVFVSIICLLWNGWATKVVAVQLREEKVQQI